MSHTHEPRLTRLLILAMAKHLPPSASTLRLLDVGSRAGALLREQRADLEPISAPVDSIAENSLDAVVAYDQDLTADWLTQALAALRPGGRLIVVNPDAQPDATLVEKLETAGYIRILVEAAVELDGAATGVLIRGEKAHATADTHARIQSVANQDAAYTDLAMYRGRYLHLLIRQQPNKPVWRLQPGEQVTWSAAAVQDGETTALLAFSSLPNAVRFMQPAVMSGQVEGVNKVAKFSRATAQTWQHPVILNPGESLLTERELVFIAIDPATAESADE